MNQALQEIRDELAIRVARTARREYGANTIFDAADAIRLIDALLISGPPISSMTIHGTFHESPERRPGRE